MFCDGYYQFGEESDELFDNHFIALLIITRSIFFTNVEQYNKLNKQHNYVTIINIIHSGNLTFVIAHVQSLERKEMHEILRRIYPKPVE